MEFANHICRVRFNPIQTVIQDVLSVYVCVSCVVMEMIVMEMIVMEMVVMVSRLTPEVGSQLAEGRFSRVLTSEQCQGAGLRVHLQLLECSELRLKQQLM